jgi:ligand-binding SRPBCC domain-containing protein
MPEDNSCRSTNAISQWFFSLTLCSTLRGEYLQMPRFEYQFQVNAPLATVAAFHKGTKVLERLTPPPIFIKIHYYEPLGEGSKARFTLWFGPLPINWMVVHRDVSENGFTDIQIEGPLASWRHIHRFTSVSENVTIVKEQIHYSYGKGLFGMLTKIMFNRISLFILFSARKWLTRRYINKDSNVRSNLTT